MGTWIVGAVILACICFAVIKLYKDRKNGKGCSGCAGCPSSGACDREKKDR